MRQFDIWDGLNWKPDWKFSYSYNNDDSLISQYRNVWDSTKWIPSSRSIFTYDSNGSQTIWLYEEWDGSDYVNSQKTSSNYDVNGNIILKLYENWDGSSWIKDYLLLYTYDENSNATSFLSESWVSETKVLKNKIFGFFDSSNRLFSFIAAKVEVFYNSLTDIKSKKPISIDFLLFQNYPNPFNPSTTIRYSILESNLVELSVFDMLGREVVNLVDKYQSIGNYTIEFNGEHLSSGVYFYKLSSGSYTASKKLILLK